MKDFEGLMKDVAGDKAIQARFKTAKTREECIDMLLEYASSKGYALSAPEVASKVASKVDGPRKLSASELSGVAGRKPAKPGLAVRRPPKRCVWFDDSSGCFAGSCSMFSFY
jgi:hypothetical protein